MGEWMVAWMNFVLNYFPGELIFYIALFVVIVTVGAIVNIAWPGDRPPRYLDKFRKEAKKKEEKKKEPKIKKEKKRLEKAKTEEEVEEEKEPETIEEPKEIEEVGELKEKLEPEKQTKEKELKEEENEISDKPSASLEDEDKNTAEE